MLKIISCITSEKSLVISHEECVDSIGCKISRYNACVYQEKIGNIIYQTKKIGLTAEQIINIRSEVCRIVEKLHSYSEYETEKQLSKLFGHKRKVYGPPPKTIKIFSDDLICYYNGEDWVKY